MKRALIHRLRSAAPGRGTALPASAGAMAASSPCSISSACWAASRPWPGLPDRHGRRTFLRSSNAAPAWSDPSDDDHLPLRDFQRIADLVGEEVGIKLPPTKRLMVEGRLRKRV